MTERKPNATPGGSLMPAMDYSKGERGDGKGQAVGRRRSVNNDLYGEGLLGDSLAPEKGGELSARFMIPPFTVLSAREGWWQDRKRSWLSLGIQSELGRGGDLLELSEQQKQQMTHGSAYVGEDGKRQTGYKGGDLTCGTGNDLDGYRNGKKMAPNKETASLKGGLTFGTSLHPYDNYGKKRNAKMGVEPGITAGTADPKPAVVAPVRPDKPLTAVRRVLAPATVASASPQPLNLPPVTWVTPTEFPNLRNVKVLGLDTETCDPDLKELGPGVRRGAYITGVSLALDETGPRLYLPVRHEGGGNMDPEQFWRWAMDKQDGLASFDGEMVGAHLLYDLDMLAEAGTEFGKVKAYHDIQIAEPLLDEWRFSYGLDTIAQEYLKEGKDENLLRQVCAAYGWTSQDQIKANMWRLNAGYVGPYATADADLPMRIWPLQKKKLEAEGLNQVYEIERKLMPILLGMRRRGVKIDLARAEQVSKQVGDARDELLAKLKHFAGPAAEFMAPESFAKALTERGLKFPLTQKTKKPSIKKAWLEQNAGDELVDTITEGRKLNTIKNTFLDGHILTHTIRGRIHCTINQLKSSDEDGDEKGAIARTSSDNPNLQNIPSRDPVMGPLIRSIFVPDEGEVWRRDDYSQIEYRLLAHYAIGQGAEECRQAYINNPKTDYHNLCAEFCGIDPNDKLQRKRVKGINFAKGYGAKKHKLAILLGCSLPEAEKFIDLYERKLPFTVATFDGAMKWAAKHGFITTIAGRKQRFPFWEPARNYGDNWKPSLPHDKALAQYGDNIVRSDAYTALNKKMQASCADIMKKAMVDSDEAGITNEIGSFLITVHDELDSSVPQTAAGQEAGRELARIMERAFTLKVPVLVESEMGANWGECT